MSSRNSILARIHILKKELNLSDADYRGMLRTGFGATSSAQLCDEDLSQLAATMHGMKMTEKPDVSEKNRKKSSKKIWAAWYDLRQYLPDGKRSAEYLCGIARKNAPGITVMNGMLDFDPLPNDQADGIIRSLISAARREKAKLADVPF